LAVGAVPVSAKLVAEVIKAKSLVLVVITRLGLRADRCLYKDDFLNSDFIRALHAIVMKFGCTK
jgi:hypothetical protein